MNGKATALANYRDNGAFYEHLCYMVSQGFHITDGEIYRALIADPRFRCYHCGRQARSYRNLCVPTEL